MVQSSSWLVRPAGRWQDVDGFPTDAYFAAVQAAAVRRGIAVNQAGRPERWNFFLLLAPEAFTSSPAHGGAESVDVGWECGPDDRPLEEGFTGWGLVLDPVPRPGRDDGPLARQPRARAWSAAEPGAVATGSPAARSAPPWAPNRALGRVRPVSPPAAITLPTGHPLTGQIRDFLADQEFAGRAGQTIRAYRGDLTQLGQHTDRDVADIDASVLRSWAAATAELAPSSRARKQAAVAAFLRWAVRHELIEANPMDRFDRTQVPEGLPRPVAPARIAAVIAAIPRPRLRDRLLFEFLASTGCRVGEALGVYLEDLDLAPGNEHVLVHGKGGRQRVLLLDDQRLVNLLRRFLRETGYSHGPLFRAGRNWTCRPLTYSTVQELWARYRAAASDEDLELLQLRHTHATELTNDGVSARTIQKRLGHRKLQTTLVYADHTDQAADAGPGSGAGPIELTRGFFRTAWRATLPFMGSSKSQRSWSARQGIMSGAAVIALVFAGYCTLESDNEIGTAAAYISGLFFSIVAYTGRVPRIKVGDNEIDPVAAAAAGAEVAAEAAERAAESSTDPKEVAAAADRAARRITKSVTGRDLFLALPQPEGIEAIRVSLNKLVQQGYVRPDEDEPPK